MLMLHDRPAGLFDLHMATGAPARVIAALHHDFFTQSR
jgi:hypothetical protein